MRYTNTKVEESLCKILTVYIRLLIMLWNTTMYEIKLAKVLCARVCVISS